MIHICIDNEQLEKAQLWKEDHEFECKEKSKHGYGKYMFIIIPTSIGELIHVQCICGLYCDITDFSYW